MFAVVDYINGVIVELYRGDDKAEAVFTTREAAATLLHMTQLGWDERA